MIKRLLGAARGVAAYYGCNRVEVSHLLFVLLGYSEVAREIVSRAGRPKAARKALQSGFRRYYATSASGSGSVVSDGVVLCLDAAKGDGAPLIAALDAALVTDGRLVEEAIAAAGLVFPDNAPTPRGMKRAVPDLDELLDGVEEETDPVDMTPDKAFLDTCENDPPEPGTASAPRSSSSKRPEPSGSGSDHAANEQADARRAAERATTDLTELYTEGGLDPVIGRDVEIDRICEILIRRRKSNVLLVGEPGVGKTALVDGVAARLAASGDPALAARPVLQASLSTLVAGARYRGDFESRLETLVDSARFRRAVLFFDEMQMLIGAGATADRGMDGANMLKPALARDGLSVIGATTHEELEQISADPALMRRFEVIRIREPRLSVMRDILPRAAEPYLTYHGITADSRTFDRMLDFADLYLPGRRFPDKAFDLLDGACVSARVGGRKRISIGDIRSSVRRLGGTLPAFPESARLAGRMREKPIREELLRHIGGQDAAMRRIAAMIARSGAHAAPRLVLQGPDGVGKRSTAVALARALGMSLLEPDADLPAGDLVSRIRTALDKEPATLVSINLEALPGREERCVAEELLSTGDDRQASGIVVTKGAVVLRRSAQGGGIGFRAAASEASTDHRDDPVLMPGFRGEALLGAVRFELARLTRVWSDAGALSPLPDAEFVVRDVRGPYPAWADVQKACRRAAERSLVT